MLCGPIKSKHSIGDVGRDDICPNKSLNSALYFRAGKFPEGIRNLTQKSDGSL